MSTRIARPAAHVLVAAALGLVLWLAFGRTAFVNYDSAWSLDWMRELLAGGRRPDLARLFSPTPHPLSDLLSAVLVPLSDGGGAARGAVGGGAEVTLVVLALLWLGALGIVTFRLGQAWFGTAAGVVAAVLILTREPVLSYGLRTYLDLPYAVFLLAALLTETRRPRNGTRTLAWITLAGLLRPDAWVLAIAYLGYLVVFDVRAGAAGGAAWSTRVDRSRLVLLVALAAVAPLGWLVEGLVLAGDPLQALTGTQQNAADLDRVTGLGSAVTVMPRRLGEIVREPVLLGAVGGVLLSLTLLRARAVLGVAAGVAAAVAFLVLAVTGLPLLTRYLIFPGVLLVLFAAGGLLGWRRLPAGHRWRRRWQAFAVVCVAAFGVFVPHQAHRLNRLDAALTLQHGVIGDLRTVSGNLLRPALAGGQCAGSRPVVALPNHRAVPQVLLWLGGDGGPRAPTVDALDQAAGRPAVTLLPVSATVARGFILDKADTGSGLPAPPRGSVRVARIGTWDVYAGTPRCATALRRAERSAG